MKEIKVREYGLKDFIYLYNTEQRNLFQLLQVVGEEVERERQWRLCN
jgi:hypothetical protein